MAALQLLLRDAAGAAGICDGLQMCLQQQHVHRYPRMLLLLPCRSGWSRARPPSLLMT